jgi:hypothetical protein
MDSLGEANISLLLCDKSTQYALQSFGMPKIEMRNKWYDVLWGYKAG